MKKAYMIPATKVVNVELQHIMAGSLNGLGENGGTMTLPGENEKADPNTDGWSRRGGLWDDED